MSNFVKATINTQEGLQNEVLIDLEETGGKIVLPLDIGIAYLVTVGPMSIEEARQFRKAKSILAAPEPVDTIPNVSGEPFSDGNNPTVLPPVTDADEADGDTSTA